MTGTKGEIATYSTDYKEVGGIMIAHTITAEFDGTPLQSLQIETVEVNEPIEDSVFKMPGMSGSMN